MFGNAWDDCDMSKVNQVTQFLKDVNACTGKEYHTFEDVLPEKNNFKPEIWDEFVKYCLLDDTYKINDERYKKLDDILNE
jgi:hypothetical protein